MKLERTGSVDDLLKITAAPGHVVINVSTAGSEATLRVTIPHEHVGSLVTRLELARDAAKHMENGAALKTEGREG